MSNTSRIFVIVNARIPTGDSRRPWADAAMVREGRVEWLGRSAEAMKRRPADAVVVDAAGREFGPDPAELLAFCQTED